MPIARPALDCAAVPAIAAWQLALRFALEIASLVALGAGARRRVAPRSSPLGWLLAFAVPLVAAAAWGTFAVKDDPSRSGKAPVAVPGWLRLAIELVVFAGGGVALGLVHAWPWLLIFAVALVVHHAGTTARLAWLLRQ